MTNVAKEEYWSIILNDPTQIGQINTEDAEFNRRINDVNLVLSNTFINSSDENLISKWETSLYIDETEGKTITERKADILYKLCEKNYVPMSIIKRFLLNLIGDENKFVVEFIKDENKLTIQFGLGTTQSQISKVQSLLDRVLPRDLVTEMEWSTGLPINYTPLEYIESTGTQYIDTGIFPKGSYKVSFSVLSRVWDGYNISNPVFFSFENTKWYFYSMNWQGIYQTAGQRGYGTQRYSLSYPPMHELNVKYDVVLDKNKTIRNGVELGAIEGEFVEEDFEFSRISILLFNRTDVKTQPTSKVLYNFSIEDNDVPVINYIPALNPEGQPGMYDTVSKVFKTNIGTGDFLYPGKNEEATTFSLRNRMYAKLTEHGVRRLYHVPVGYDGSKEEYAEQNGFKLLVETPMPEESYWTPVWSETENEIVLGWIETEAPSTEDFNLEQPTEI